MGSKGWKETGPAIVSASETTLRMSSTEFFSSQCPPSIIFSFPAHFILCFLASSPGSSSSPSPPSWSSPAPVGTGSAAIVIRSGLLHMRSLIAAGLNLSGLASEQLDPGTLQRNVGWGNSFSPYLDSDSLSWPHLQWVWWPSAAPNLDIPLACYQPTLQADIFLAQQISLLMVLWPFPRRSPGSAWMIHCSESSHSSQMH